MTRQAERTVDQLRDDILEEAVESAVGLEAGAPVSSRPVAQPIPVDSTRYTWALDVWLRSERRAAAFWATGRCRRCARTFSRPVGGVRLPGAYCQECEIGPHQQLLMPFMA